MKQQYKQKREEGFTIIEVLIVLAIAALILVVVLVAIPQLQRNQRNSARQNDAARVVTAVQNWSANNNGRAFPTGSGVHLTSLQDDLGDLTQYDVENITSVSPSNTVVDDINVIRVVPGAACAEPDASTPQGSVTTSGISSRAVSVQFAVETAGGTESRCVSS